MKSFNRTLFSAGRTIAAVGTLAGALFSPPNALAAEDPLARAVSTEVSASLVRAHPFTLGVTSGIDYFTYRIDVPARLSVTSFVATLFSGSTSIVSGVDGSPPGAMVPNSFLLGSLAPVAYQLGVSGIASGASGVDSYSGLLRVTAPVAPIEEPEIWAMMLVGCALVGLRLRRKSRLDNARHFA